MNKWTFIFILLMLSGGVCAISIRPLTQATAGGIAQREAIKAESLAAAARETAAAAELRTSERAATSAARVTFSRVAIGGGVFLIVAIGAAFAFRAGGDMVQSVRLARLPVTRQIAPGAFVTMIDGRGWLIDAYSGRRALLSSAADVDQVRAAIMAQSLTVDRLSLAAERIATRTGDAAPADFLPHIGQMTQIRAETQP